MSALDVKTAMRWVNIVNGYSREKEETYLRGRSQM